MSSVAAQLAAIHSPPPVGQAVHPLVAEETYSVDDVAELLNIPKCCVYELMHQNKLVPLAKISRHSTFSAAAVASLMPQNDAWITSVAAAEQLGFPSTFIARWARRGLLNESRVSSTRFSLLKLSRQLAYLRDSGHTLLISVQN